MSHEQEHEDVGSVHEEAVRLLGALGQWAQDTDRTESLEGDCRYCPVCQLIHVVRQTSPEVREHLAVAATALTQAVAELLATRGAPGTGATGGADVERIDLDDDGPSTSR